MMSDYSMGDVTERIDFNISSNRGPDGGYQHVQPGNLSTGGSNESCTGLSCYSDFVFHVATGITILLALFGAVGNVLTVLAILTSKLRQNINSILICNLSFADATYCSVLLPLQAVTFYHKEWMLPAIWCELHAALRILLIGVNMTLLSCIAIYRFIHVVYPQSHTRFSKSPWFTIACIICWAVPFVFAFTPLVGWWGTYSFQERILQCSFSTISNRSHKITTITMGYVIPCVFISVCYARIGCVVFSSRKRASRGSQYRRQRARRESFRLTGMMVLIFLGFLLGTTPFFTVNTLDSGMRSPMLHIWTSFLAWVMYGLNPVIYTVMDANFQHAYRRLLLCSSHKPDTAAEISIQERQTSVLVTKSDKLLVATRNGDKTVVRN